MLYVVNMALKLCQSFVSSPTIYLTSSIDDCGEDIDKLIQNNLEVYIPQCAPYDFELATWRFNQVQGILTTTYTKQDRVNFRTDYKSDEVYQQCS